MLARPGRCREGPMAAGSSSGAAAPLLTRAERTDYQETSLHADVVRFVRQVARRAPELLRVGTIGASAEGRAMPVVVLSGHGAFTPAAARRLGRPVVMVCA